MSNILFVSNIRFYNVIMISSVYAHPFEVTIGNVFPLMFSTMILKHRMHAITLVAWTVMRLIETKDAHSGYEFPFSMFRAIPFTSGAPFHNYHHLKNIGNYATFTWVWDYIFGTSKQYDEYVKKVQESGDWKEKVKKD
jgi:sterol desaturase/sphingolipid hydroxylase (fatty acid hydroxylase superfamily)